ncbi:MBOAT, membrane-bound O-acyltransferase family-domain-containing protein, partial [Filobasidium floriforme]|uniref:MBOAT, membrane-bound O-acyltransferase family-domain-containing protein n=1 Tax=Filobasidium floriforme TaxID=5210 RepID=UPI001E8E36F7
MSWIDVPFERASPLIGAPPDHLKLIFILVSSYPLAHIFTRLPPTAPHLKHLFSIVLTSFYLVGMFRMKWGYIQLVADAVAVWGIVVGKVGVRRDGRGEGWMPWLVFVLIMGHLTVNHAYRAFTNIPDSVMEITAMQMVTTMKLITFAWNVEDGRNYVEPGSNEDKSGSAPATMSQVDPALAATRLPPSRIPTLLPFLGYVLFFPSLIGPASDYASYEALIDGSIFTSPPGTNEASRKASSPRSARPLIPKGRKSSAYRKLVTGLIMLGIYAVFGGQWSYGRIIDPELAKVGWWASKGILRKWMYVMIAGFIARTKYYALWSISEGACILTGIGFNGYSTGSPVSDAPKALWDRVENIDIWKIETAQSFKVLFDSWNCRANVWLRDTMYKRLVKPGQKPGFAPTVMTFVTSAFWHGIGTGYYLAFITAGICTSLGRQMRHLVRPFFLPENIASHSTVPKQIYDVLSWLTVMSLINYVVAAFLLLSWHDCLLAWTRMGWAGHAVIGIAWIGLKYGGARWLKR